MQEVQAARDLVTKIGDAFSCSVCRNVASVPVVLPCGHIFCAICLAGSCRDVCPVCRTPRPPDPAPAPPAICQAIQAVEEAVKLAPILKTTAHINIGAEINPLYIEPPSLLMPPPSSAKTATKSEDSVLRPRVPLAKIAVGAIPTRELTNIARKYGLLEPPFPKGATTQAKMERITEFIRRWNIACQEQKSTDLSYRMVALAVHKSLYGGSPAPATTPAPAPAPALAPSLLPTPLNSPAETPHPPAVSALRSGHNLRPIWRSADFVLPHLNDHRLRGRWHGLRLPPRNKAKGSQRLVYAALEGIAKTRRSEARGRGYMPPIMEYRPLPVDLDPHHEEGQRSEQLLVLEDHLLQDAEVQTDGVMRFSGQSEVILYDAAAQTPISSKPVENFAPFTGIVPEGCAAVIDLANGRGICYDPQTGRARLIRER